MLSLLLITALAVQNPPASKPTTDTTAQRRTTTAAPRGTSQSAVGRAAFHDRMRELWSDHIVYTRNFIVSASAGMADTAEVLQRLLRNQDELGEAIKPYYGDAAGSQLASLLRNHIQLAGKALVAAKGSTTAMAGMNTQDGSSQSSQTYLSNRASDTVTANSQNSQYPTTSGRMNDTASTKAGRATVTDSTKVKANAQYPAPSARNRTQSDTTKKQPNARVTGDTMSQRLPSNQYGAVRTDSTQGNSAQSGVYAQGQTQTQMQGQSQMGTQMQGQNGQVDSVSLNQAIADLKSNADSIATFLSTANPRGFQREALRSAIQMHITLLLKEATAQIKKDWSGSISAFDESQRQAIQMADMLSDGIMKQFPSRFSNKATTVSSR